MQMFRAMWQLYENDDGAPCGAPCGGPDEPPLWHGLAVAGALEAAFTLGFDPVRWMPNVEGEPAPWGGHWPWSP